MNLLRLVGMFGGSLNTTKQIIAVSTHDGPEMVDQDQQHDDDEQAKVFRRERQARGERDGPNRTALGIQGRTRETGHP
jgi:hypothetical protein